VDSIEEHLAAAARRLPTELAISMYTALRDDSYRIGVGSYDSGSTLCPLGAADAVAEAEGKGRFPGWSEDEQAYAGRVLRFAICFDLCSKQKGLSFAVGFLRDALSRRLEGGNEA
jgi:hypothetical protein